MEKISDKDIQDLHQAPKSKFQTKMGDSLKVKGKLYTVVVDSKDSVTQAIAVAPKVNDKTDYNQTTIIVAGTQPISEGLDKTRRAPTGNAFEAKKGLTPQTDDIIIFYNQVNKVVKSKGGQPNDGVW